MAAADLHSARPPINSSAQVVGQADQVAAAVPKAARRREILPQQAAAPERARTDHRRLLAAAFNPAALRPVARQPAVAPRLLAAVP
jgi:hypothetical protein